jgi:hypothetical protein
MLGQQGGEPIHELDRISIKGVSYRIKGRLFPP